MPLEDLVESSFIMDLKYDGLYRSWAFLTSRLVKDKTIIPLLESNYCVRGIHILYISS